jgi:hypothetical protein
VAPKHGGGLVGVFEHFLGDPGRAFGSGAAILGLYQAAGGGAGGGVFVAAEGADEEHGRDA